MLLIKKSKFGVYLNTRRVSKQDAGIYRWSIILADTNFFQQSVSVSAANFRGRDNRPSAKHFFIKLLAKFVHKIPKCLADGRLFLPLKSAADTDTDC